MEYGFRGQDARGHLIDTGGRFLNARGHLIDTGGRFLNAHGHLIDARPSQKVATGILPVESAINSIPVPRRQAGWSTDSAGKMPAAT